MPHVLEVTTEFLKSDDLPEVSIFSGATEHIEEQRFSVNRFTPWWVLCAVAGGCPGILVTTLAANRSYSVRIPQVAGEGTAWHWKMHGWFVPAYVISGIQWVCLLNAEYFGFIPFLICVGLFALTLIPALIGTLWYRANLVQFDPLAGRRVKLIFPDHLAETCQIFREAYRRYEAGEEPLPRRRREEAEEEPWTDQVETGWDEKRP